MRPLPPEPSIEGARATILGCVTRYPGVHLRDVERRTELPLGQVLYHLDRLERMGLVVSARDAGFRRYYLTKEVGRAQKRYLAALRHDAPRHVIVALLERPGLTHKELQALLQVAGSTLSFHLQRLLTSGVLLRDRRGTANHYALADPTTARHELIYYRESFQDPVVDGYVRRMLDTLPPPPEPASAAVPAVDARPPHTPARAPATEQPAAPEAALEEEPHVALVPS